MSSGVVVKCPSCDAPVAWTPASRWRPFCSERCRLLDLGDWLDEAHRVHDRHPDDAGGDGTPWPEDGDG